MIKQQISYWSRLKKESEKDKLSGLAFSILNIIDGTASGLPAMDLVLRPHENDKKEAMCEGSNWWEDGMVINDDCMLHEEFYTEDRERPQT